MVERRDFVRGMGVVTAGLLAGCSEGELEGTATTAQDASEETMATESASESSTPTETDAPTETDSPTPTAADEDAVELTIQNVGSTAWRVSSDESGSVAETGVENPELTFQVGQRYLIRNGGWSGHPFAFLAADDTVLLSQDGDGSFEGDSEVDWVDEGGSFAFTVTQELADELSTYVCTIHGLMRGDVTTE